MIEKPIDTNQEAHMIGVAENMYHHANKYGLDPEEMYLIGLLHDIGYISRSKEGHEQYGATLIKMFFNQLRYALYWKHNCPPWCSAI